MRSVKLLILCLACSVSAFAQYDGKEKDVASRHRPGLLWYNTGWRPAETGKARKYDRLMADLSFNSWMTGAKFVPVQANSIGYRIHLMHERPLTEDNGMSLAYGLSYRFQRISLNGYLQRDTMNKSTQIQSYMTGQEPLERSFFGSHALAIPFEVRFRNRRWKQFKLHLGAYAGYSLQNFTKVRYPGADRSVKNMDFFDDTKFIYGFHLRAGIRNWAVFVDYAPAPQFSSKLSTKLHAVSAGITLSVF